MRRVDKRWVPVFPRQQGLAAAMDQRKPKHVPRSILPVPAIALQQSQVDRAGTRCARRLDTKSHAKATLAQMAMALLRRDSKLQMQRKMWEKSPAHGDRVQENGNRPRSRGGSEPCGKVSSSNPKSGALEKVMER